MAAGARPTTNDTSPAGQYRARRTTSLSPDTVCAISRLITGICIYATGPRAHCNRVRHRQHKILSVYVTALYMERCVCSLNLQHCRILVHECARICNSSCVVDKFEIFTACSWPFADMSGSTARLRTVGHDRHESFMNKKKFRGRWPDLHEYKMDATLSPTCLRQCGSNSRCLANFRRTLTIELLTVVYITNLGWFQQLTAPT